MPPPLSYASVGVYCRKELIQVYHYWISCKSWELSCTYFWGKIIVKRSIQTNPIIHDPRSNRPTNFPSRFITTMVNKYHHFQAPKYWPTKFDTPAPLSPFFCHHKWEEKRGQCGKREKEEEWLTTQAMQECISKQTVTFSSDDKRIIHVHVYKKNWSTWTLIEHAIYILYTNMYYAFLSCNFMGVTRGVRWVRTHPPSDQKKNKKKNVIIMIHS